MNKTLVACLLSAAFLHMTSYKGERQEGNIQTLFGRGSWHLLNELNGQKYEIYDFPEKKPCEGETVECEVSYIYKGPLHSKISSQDSRYLYLPAIGGKLRSISVNDVRVEIPKSDYSGTGPIFKIPDSIALLEEIELRIRVDFSNSPFSGLWKGPPKISDINSLILKRDWDHWEQDIVPLISSILFGLFSLLFISLHFAARKRYPFYWLFGICLASWSLFYLFLSGKVREFNFELGWRLHLVARSAAWIGTWALTLSYVHFSMSGRRHFTQRFMNSGIALGILLMCAQFYLAIRGQTSLQWVLFAITSPFAFTPMLMWQPGKIKYRTFSFLTFLLCWVAMLGSLQDASKILLKEFSKSFSAPVASRYTFPFLLAASAFIYVMHFAKVLRKLRQNNLRLKRLNQAALVLSGADLDRQSLNEFATSLRKAMKTHRSCVAALGDDGSYRVMGLSGLPEAAFGSQIDTKKNQVVTDALALREPQIGFIETLDPTRYKSQSFAVVPVMVSETVRFLLLFSDPLKGEQFSKSDLLYMRQFGLMMTSSCQRLEADGRFKKLVSHLDSSLFAYISGHSSAAPNASDNKASWRGVGFFDQAGFVRTSNSLSQQELIQLVEIVKRWAAPLIMKHGGRIRSFGGDAYLFDICAIGTESKSSTALRLAKSLWELCETQSELNRELLSKGLAPVNFRFGGHVGEAQDVSLLELGANVTTIIGGTVNLAQRIQSVAPPGTVLLSEDAATLISEEFEVRPTWNDKMKDISANVKIYRVHGFSVTEASSMPSFAGAS